MRFGDRLRFQERKGPFAVRARNLSNGGDQAVWDHSPTRQGIRAFQSSITDGFSPLRWELMLCDVWSNHKSITLSVFSFGLLRIVRPF